MGKIRSVIEGLIIFWKKYITGSYDETPNWLLRGKAIGAAYLIVVWDSFDLEQFPVFVMPGDDLERVKRIYNQSPTTNVSKIIAIEGHKFL